MRAQAKRAKTRAHRSRRGCRTRKKTPQSLVRGRDGERWVWDRALDFLTDVRASYPASLERMADEPYRGDLLWIENDMRVHIEIKNVRNVGEKNLIRFERNVRKDCMDHGTHAAMFVNVHEAPVTECMTEDEWVVFTEYRIDAWTKTPIPVVWVRGVGDDPQRLYEGMSRLREWNRLRNGS